MLKFDGIQSENFIFDDDIVNLLADLDGDVESLIPMDYDLKDRIIGVPSSTNFPRVSHGSFDSETIDSNHIYPQEDCATVISEGLSDITTSGNISDADKSYHSTIKRRKVVKSTNQNIQNYTGNSSLVKLPRVLKNDIRRNYANIFSNVMNSADEDLTRAFFKKFTLPNFSFYFIVKDGTRNISGQKVFHGRGNAFRHFMVKYAALPDLYTRVAEAKLRTSTAWNGKSELIAAMTATGTQIYSIPEEHDLSTVEEVQNIAKTSQVEELAVILPTPKDKGTNRISEVEKHQRMLLGKKRKAIRSISTSQNIVDEIADFEDEFKALRISPKLLPNPKYITCQSTIRFALDENKMIERIEMHAAAPPPITSVEA